MYILYNYTRQHNTDRKNRFRCYRRSQEWLKFSPRIEQGILESVSAVRGPGLPFLSAAALWRLLLSLFMDSILYSIRMTAILHRVKRYFKIRWNVTLVNKLTRSKIPGIVCMFHSDPSLLNGGENFYFVQNCVHSLSRK